jgi:N-acylneuraminate cytidylyltransferase
VRSIAIIPARGGSERIPGKNIKPFEGQPIIAYAIGAARESAEFDTIMVSTDSEEIASVARSYAAEVPFLRSAVNASSRATTVAVLLEVIDAYAQRGQHFELGCCIYPCNPFLTAEKISRAKRQLQSANLDCVLSAVRYGSAVQRAFLVEQDRMRLLFPEHRDTRSQDLPPAFHDAAQFYYFRVDALLTHKALLTENAGVIELPDAEVQDIDTPEDWARAEHKHRAWKRTQG